MGIDDFTGASDSSKDDESSDELEELPDDYDSFKEFEPGDEPSWREETKGVIQKDDNGASVFYIVDEESDDSSWAIKSRLYQKLDDMC